MKHKSQILIFFLLFFVKQSFSQLQCDNDTTGLKSLIDLQLGYYLGFQGGLYPDGQNTMPSGHFAAGMNISREVLPLNSEGNVDLVEGKAGFICLGASTAGNAFNHFKTFVEDDPTLNPCLTMVNAAVGAKGLEVMIDTLVNNWYWSDNVMVDIENSNLTRHQVQVIWLMVTSRVDTILIWPYQARQVSDKYEALMPVLLAKFPNLKQVYLSGFPYGGYADPTKEFYTMINEPSSYWNNWSVKFLIERQLDADADLKFTAPGKKSPWLAWGPHIWADGMRKNYTDNLYWNCLNDFKEDGGGYHLSIDGKKKEGALIYNFFKNSTLAADWFKYPARWMTCDPDFRLEGTNSNQSEITIFPNPGNGIAYIKMDNCENGKLSVFIFNALGQEVYQTNAEISDNFHLEELKLSNHPAGIYQVLIITANNHKTISFIKQ